jgi:NUMOD4 motif
MGERWLPVPGYHGWYEVSDAGSVYSLARPATRGGLLIPHVSPAGYRFVRLSKYGQVRSVTVGRLVLAAFRGPAQGRRARHGLGGRLDDRLANLEWA